MSWPSVSVVVPMYRQADFVVACLNSIAAQDYPGPLEVLVIDDGSPDEGASLARAHSLAPTVLCQPNQGVSHARNRGIEASTGDFIAFLDADDRWVPGKLTRQLEAMSALNRPCLSFTRYRRVRMDGRDISAQEHPARSLEPTARQLTRQNFVGTSTAVVHRACLERTGVFPDGEDLRKGGQDYALWLRIASLFPMVYVPEVLTLYTVHDSNRVGTDPLKHHRGGLAALRDFSRWSPDRFVPLAGLSTSGIRLVRSIRLLRDSLLRHHEYPSGQLPRTLSWITRSMLSDDLPEA